MIPKISLSRVKIRPTNRKIERSLYAAQQTAVSMKRQASTDTKPTIIMFENAICFIKDTLCHRPN